MNCPFKSVFKKNLYWSASKILTLYISRPLTVHKLQAILPFCLSACMSLWPCLCISMSVLSWREKPRCSLGRQHCVRLMYSLTYPRRPSALSIPALSDLHRKSLHQLWLFLETLNVGRKLRYASSRMQKLLATRTSDRFLRSAWTLTSQPPRFQTSSSGKIVARNQQDL